MKHMCIKYVSKRTYIFLYAQTYTSNAHVNMYTVSIHVYVCTHDACCLLTETMTW